MPAAITHFLHAQQVWDNLDKNGIVASQRLVYDAFLWGAQGPDFLFSHRFLPWQKGDNLMPYGFKMHAANPAAILSAMREYLEKFQSNTVRSYIYGFLCHYSLDSTCHPYIVWRAKQLLQKDSSQSEIIFHNEIESAIDCIMLRHETGKLPSDIRMQNLIPKNADVQEQIAGLYVYVFQKIFGVQVNQARILQATNDMRKSFSLLNDRTSFKKMLLSRVEKGKQRKLSCFLRGMMENPDVDYANVNNETWSPVDNYTDTSNESFIELFDKAVVKAQNFIPQFDNADFKELTENRPF